MNARMSALRREVATVPADLPAVKASQQEMWASGDYAAIGTQVQIVAEALAEALDLRAGEKVLDVAAGNGNFSLAAARRQTDVTATDYVPTLLERGRARAAAEGLAIDFREADAEALSFADASFDVVASTFGVMYTPDQERASAEMIRVSRPGGRIGMANWTPAGFVGQVLKTIAAHVPPPDGVRSPALWGTREHLADLFGPQAARIDTRLRKFVFRYPSPEYCLEHFRTNYGPVLKAFAALDHEGREALTADLLALAGRFNTGGDTMMVASDYLEVVIMLR